MNEYQGLLKLAYKSIDETKGLLEKVNVLFQEGSMKSLSKAIEVTEGTDLDTIHSIARDLLFNRLESALVEKGYRISRYDNYGSEESNFRVYLCEFELGKIDPRNLSMITVNPEEEIKWRESILKNVHREDFQEEIARFEEMKPVLEEFVKVSQEIGFQVL